MKVIRAINEYFLGDDVSISDRIWFYGLYAVSIFVTVLSLLPLVAK
ncbi:hypothetical protein SAMN05880501_10775 [Ureibacillus xyleni]|uniref:Uncharacterized protein n=1 Tax=Ureibacillus xyleni TaxID=614648 RepID=A0A285SX43_9BACL|nr:hypothetical protein [Ureibacillus xyleni]SOC12925.1 hypothetical protein SAMN05880501_10775 [Ureibacillus xyleni]